MTAQLFKSHSFRLGTDMRRQALDDIADNFSRDSGTLDDGLRRTTYATPYAAFFDGCVFQFQKGYGPFFLENRMSESNVYLQDDWRIIDSVTLNLGLRYEYVAAPRRRKVASTIFSVPTRTISNRASASPTLLSGKRGFLRKIGGGPGRIAFHAGYGIYDGRIFQSVFSQGGANVRFNPPDALHPVEQPAECLGSDQRVRVRPGRADHANDRYSARSRPRSPSTSKWNLSVERIMPWDSTLKVTYQGNHNDKRLKYPLDNLPLSPLDGPVTVVDHPLNAPAAACPTCADESSMPSRQTSRAPGRGCQTSRQTRPVR